GSALKPDAPSDVTQLRNTDGCFTYRPLSRISFSVSSTVHLPFSRLPIPSPLLKIALDVDEDVLEPEFPVDHRLVVKVADQRLHGRAVALGAVRPPLLAEHLVGLLDVSAHPRQHVARRAEI